MDLSIFIFIAVLPLFILCHQVNQIHDEEGLKIQIPFQNEKEVKLLGLNSRQYRYRDIIADIEMNNTKRYLLLLYERMHEPIFMPKGPKNTVFVIPDSYYIDRFKSLKKVYSDPEFLTARFGEVGERVVIKDLSDKFNKMTNFTAALAVGQNTSFLNYLINGNTLINPIVQAFLLGSLEDFLSTAVYARDRMNPYQFVILMSNAILNRNDTRSIAFPCLAEVLPDVFMPGDTVNGAREQSYIAPEWLREPAIIPVNVTGSEQNVEQRVAYFREDMGLNLNHWHWHFSYARKGLVGVPKKDRDGELFYYFHEQALNRYNFERLSNKLPLVVTFPTNLGEPMSEGYYPKLHSCAGNRAFPVRVPNLTLSDSNRPQDNFSAPLSDLETWQSRINQAIRDGFVVTDTGVIRKLDEVDGIDILGNLIESNIQSLNRPFYGNLHNMGHLMISVANDPMGLYLEQPTQMLDQATSMTDPIFFRWHTLLNNQFLDHKNRLPSYSKQDLSFSGVAVKSIDVTLQGSRLKNVMMTKWQQDELDISRGLDFSIKGRVPIIFTHLDHDPFTYRIQVLNNGKPKRGTCRILLAPKLNESGVPFTFAEQKNFFIELDKFIVDLKPGLNTIIRKSEISTVTVPFDVIFRQPDALSAENKTYVACGWPHHLLVPKGSPEGLPSQLFVMISNYEEDKVVEDSDLTREGGMPQFERGVSYCGRRGKYPDKRAMGYPFDRPLNEGVTTLQQFLLPNMAAIDVIIIHISSDKANGS